MKHDRRRFLQQSIAVSLSASPFLAGAADAYPSKPIRWVIGLPAGGVSDLMARTVAQRLSERLNQQVVVENRPGATGIIAADVVAKSAPDGYSLLFGTPGPMAILPALGAKLPFDVNHDLRPVGLVGRLPLVLVVPASLPARNLSELLALARSSPGKLNYASTGAGSVSHLGMEMLKYAARVKIEHVPYKGQSAAMADLIAGNVQMLLDGWATTTQHVTADKLRFLAVAGPTRSRAHAQVPTFGESGFPGFDASPWYGAWAPSATPPDVAKRFEDALLETVSSTAVATRLEELGMEALPGNSARLSSFVLHEKLRWTDIIRQTNLKLE